MTCPAASGPIDDAASVYSESWRRQQQLLRYFALADLLGVSSTVNQQLLTAAATSFTSMGHTPDTPHAHSHRSTASDPAMHAHHLEDDILVDSVVQRLLDRCSDSNMSMSNARDPTKAVRLVVPSVVRRTQQPVRKQQPPSLTAVPWTAAPLSSQRSSPPPQQPSKGSHLPSVLSCPQGVARVDDLHAAFLPLLLVALLECASGQRGGSGVHITGSMAPMPRGDSDSDTVETDKPVSFPSPAQQRSCREALQKLLPLYMPLLLRRQRAVCDVVSAIVEALQVCSCGHHENGESTTEEEERQRRAYRLVHRDLCNREVKQWIYAVGHLSDTLVMSLSHVNREVGVAPAAPPPSSGAVGEDEDGLMEARWALETAGTWLRAAGLVHQDSVPVAKGPGLLDFVCRGGASKRAEASASIDSEQPQPNGGILVSVSAPSHRGNRGLLSTTAKTLALAEVMCTIVEETCNDICPCDVFIPPPPLQQQQQQQPDGGGHCNEPCESEPSSFAGDGSHFVSALRDVLTLFRAGHHKNSTRDPDTTLSSPELAPVEPQHRHGPLLAKLQEKEQGRQHRLLAAAERAVQQILHQQHHQHSGALWQSPDMVVALCSVTAHQLHVQLHRHEQRMADLFTASPATATAAMSAVLQRNIASFSSTVNAPSVDQGSHSGNGDASECSRHHGSPSGDGLPTAEAAKKPQLGKTLWLDDDEDDENAAAQLIKDQGRLRANSVEAEAELSSHDVRFPSTPDTATPVSAAAAADATILMSSHPPPSVSSAPSAAPVSTSPPYTPRNSQSSSSIPPSRYHEALTTIIESQCNPHAANKSVEDTGPPTCSSNDLYAPAGLMERLWELPARVPQDWTPALATLMACCSLCLSSSATKSRFSVPLGEPLLSNQTSETGALRSATTTTTAVADFEYSASGATEKRAASPKPTFFGFGLNGRPEVSTVMAPSRSVRSSVCNRSNTNSISGVSTAVDSTGGGNESAATVMAVGALAQWHLRGLIRQLRLPANGRVLLTEPAGTDGRQGTHTINSNTRSGRVPSSSSSSSSAPLASATHRTSTKLSPGGVAVKGAKRSDTWGAPSSSSSSPPAGGVLRRLDPVSLLASCFALMHLMQTQPRFFEYAKLSGRTMCELQLGVLEARWSSEPGCATEMLQRYALAAARGAVVSTAPTPISSVSGAPAGGRTDDPTSPPRGIADPFGHCQGARGFTRSRSLWSGDCGTQTEETSVDGLLRMDASGSDVHDNNVGGYGDAPDRASSPAAATCAFTEAFLVAASYVGCRALATSLRQVAATELDRREVKDLTRLSCGEWGLSAAVRDSSRPSRDLWADVLQAISGLLLEAHWTHRRSAVAIRRARGMATAAALCSTDQKRSRSRPCSHGVLQPVTHSVNRANMHPPPPPAATVEVKSPGPRASTCASGPPPQQLSDPQRAFTSEAVPITTSTHATPVLGDADGGPNAGLTHAVLTSTVPTMPSPLSTEAQFGIGSFFIALVRALLQLHASWTAAAAASDKSRHDQKPQHQDCPPRLLCVVQCLYAVASIIDDLLHDYVNAPPAALCDVLATMLVMQPQHSSAMLKTDGAAAPSPNVSARHSAWEALRLTPFWNGVLLGSLESASRAWISPKERRTTAASGNREDGRSRAHESRRPLSSTTGSPGSPKVSHGPPSLQRSCPPWQNLLGHIPCSRDAFATSWLPLAFRGPSHSSTSWTLLAQLATEEDLLLAGPSTTMTRYTAPTTAAMTGSDDLHEVPATGANAAGEFQQMSVSLVSCARYVQWIDTLCDAWRV
ncbi:hypothetical protein JKF63_06091 [Porcisia hertigi]|uniref:Uncharacterized protein n=1 Tax=Porcisia hertigi TaxID=2761500 RepID=A0A836IZ48_9TRYP|nr:hypothetical protein JKF63_06091 [Porcisia hertigi]